MSGFDPSIVQDFLTESGELLEQLDQDLVVLEQRPDDPDLLNQIFRALHTIKGSASFLALTELVRIAHAAESALNAARNRQVVVDRPAMDLLLQATDILKRQFACLAEGTPLPEPPDDLVAALAAMGEGRAPGASSPAKPQPSASEPAGATAPPASQADEQAERPLDLPPGKVELVEFLIADLRQCVTKLDSAGQTLTTSNPRAVADVLGTLAEELSRSVEFFGIQAVVRLAALISNVAGLAREHPEGAQGVSAAGARLARACKGIAEALTSQADGLSAGKLRPLDAAGIEAEVAAAREPISASNGEPADPASEVSVALATPPAADHEPADAPARSPRSAEPDAASATSGAAPAQAGTKAQPADTTIRVEVSRLEALLNLVGELVLQKNRICALGRQLLAHNLGTQDFREGVTRAMGGLERATSEIQVAVMRTRLQHLDKLFGRYPRLIRDLARKTNKNIRLEIEGGDTEVDKSVIEELGDPLIHLLRNSADHGIELPDVRVAAGKPAEGVIRLVAQNQGGHVCVRIIDDGKGLDKQRIAAKAVERGLTTEAAVAGMSDRDIYNFIFAAGFSTAEQVSDLSGRGVGMDVVRTNIEKIKGTIELATEQGKGTTITIKIPLTVAIMPAMMIGVGGETYAVPLNNIVEIVKPDSLQRGTISSSPVMRLRDEVLPLLDSRSVFGHTSDADVPFAVVLDAAERRVGLLVTRLIGQQEIVIKPLDEITRCNGPVAGATVRDDGGVSLIVDVQRMIADAEASKGHARAA